MRFVVAVRYATDEEQAGRLAQAVSRLLAGTGVKRVLTPRMEEVQQTARAIARALGVQRAEICLSLLFENAEYDLQYDHAQNLVSDNCDALVVVMTGDYSPAGILSSFRREWQFEPVELFGVPHGTGVMLNLMSGKMLLLP